MEHVVIKSSRAGMALLLDPDCGFEDLLEEIRGKFAAHADFWGSVRLVLSLEGRVLSPAEELALVNAVTERTGIEVLCVLDQDLNRIERCEKALNEKLMEITSRTGQFYRGNLSAGESLETEAGIVIIGDVLSGGRVTAKGSIIVLGELRGSAAAGAAGNREAVVAALEMAPSALSIASEAAVLPKKPRRLCRGPMAAFLEKGQLCLRPLKKDFREKFKKTV